MLKKQLIIETYVFLPSLPQLQIALLFLDMRYGTNKAPLVQHIQALGLHESLKQNFCSNKYLVRTQMVFCIVPQMTQIP